jgi:hypothetical protein
VIWNDAISGKILTSFTINVCRVYLNLIQRKQIQKLMEFRKHFVAYVHQVRVFLAQRFGQRTRYVGDTAIHKWNNRFLVHVFQDDRVCFGGQLGATVTTKINFCEAVDERIEFFNRRIRCLVTAERKRLPMVQFDLVTHSEKEMNIGGAHLLYEHIIIRTIVWNIYF